MHTTMSNKQTSKCNSRLKGDPILRTPTFPFHRQTEITVNYDGEQWDGVVYKIAVDQRTCTVRYTADGSFEPNVPPSRINMLTNKPVNQADDDDEGEEPSTHDESVEGPKEGSPPIINLEPAEDDTAHVRDPTNDDDADTLDKDAIPDCEPAPAYTVDTGPSVSGGAEIDDFLQEPCLRTKKAVHKVNRALKSIMKVKCFAQ